jgi:hypothetical protein
MLPLAPGGACQVRSISSPPTLAPRRLSGGAGLDPAGGSTDAGNSPAVPVAVTVLGVGVGGTVEVNVGLDVGVLVLV